LHWLIVLGLAAQYFLAEAADGDEVGGPMGLRRPIGITLLGLAVLRLGWRLLDRRPLWPSTMTGYGCALARITRLAFYLLLFLLPLTGWRLSSAEGDAIDMIGLLEVPPLVPVGAADAYEEGHELLFNVLLAF